MSMPTESKAWYALAIKPRHEKVTAVNLRARDLEEFLPVYQSKHRWSDRTKTVEQVLFPGYIFCRFGSEDRRKVLTAPGVISIVSVGKAPAAVEEAEIASIHRMIRSGLPLEPWSYLKVGQRVRIDSGPLCGLEGTLVREKGCSRVVVHVNALQRAVAVEIERESLSSDSGTLLACEA